MGLRCIQKRKFKATTNSAHSLPVVENLLDQQLTVSDPGTVYGTDITYIPSDEGWLYPAGVKDLATKEIIGHSMASRMTKELTHTALDGAVRYRRPEPGYIHRSDRGSQYCATSYQHAIVALGVRPLTSRKGNRWLNSVEPTTATVESFWGALKAELVYHRRFCTRIETQAAIQEFIEAKCGNRISSSSGCLVSRLMVHGRFESIQKNRDLVDDLQCRVDSCGQPSYFESG